MRYKLFLNFPFSKAKTKLLKLKIISKLFPEQLEKGVVGCTVCTTFVEIIDSKLVANATIQEVTKLQFNCLKAFHL